MQKPVGNLFSDLSFTQSSVSVMNICPFYWSTFNISPTATLVISQLDYKHDLHWLQSTFREQFKITFSRIHI